MIFRNQHSFDKTFDRFQEQRPSTHKWQKAPWGLFITTTLMCCVGFFMLISAANGSIYPWAFRQLIRFFLGIGLCFFVSTINIRFFFKYSYFFYAFSLFFLLGVEFLGFVGMGAKRWINFYFFYVQPSDLMKISLVLALSRYFHDFYERKNTLFFLIPPVLLIAFPVLVILRQPDLGTALLLSFVGVVVLFVCGVRWVFFAISFGGCCVAAPILWSMLWDYQKKRILVFLNPESDPLGSGYHILQSCIAIGSGGLTGKGFLKGSQSHLDFLPEKQTDFIFTMLGEEFGFLGCCAFIGLYGLFLFFCYRIVFRSEKNFTLSVAVGLSTVFFLHFFINIAMVTALIPVVGMPLPFVSYGGTSLITLLVGVGLMGSVSMHQDARFSSY